MTLAEAANVVQGTLIGGDVTFSAVATDTRKLRGGELFVALTGDRFDGHDFLDGADAAGAVAAFVSQSRCAAIPMVKVKDTRLALGHLAGHWRTRTTAPVIAVTGSNGKTTVKEMIGAILGETGRGLVSAGNLNNDIGLPVSLLRVRAGDGFVVLEMGMNHIGEIDYLTRLAKPTIAVITNAAEAHLEGLGNVMQVARAKAEIFNGLRVDGVAVVNADDPHAALWQERAAPHRCVTFGFCRQAQVSASFELQRSGAQLALRTAHGTTALNLPLAGKHNVLNALAAAATALEAGADLAAVKAGLEAMRPLGGRLQQRQGVNGAQVLDDSYNANPGSLQAALEVLAAYPAERVLVLGDMAELGESAKRVHTQAGKLAKRCGIERLLAVGELTRYTVKEFGPGGTHFASEHDLVQELLHSMGSETTVLIKGSRCMGMERIAGAICNSDLPGHRNAEAYH